jgi:hypothetical protein
MDKKEFEYDHGLGFEYNYDTPTQAFLQFKGGIGESFSRAYYFGDCPMTKAMREHPHMYFLRGEIKNALMIRDIGNNQTIPTFRDFRKNDHSFYSVPMQNIINDAIIIMTETFSSMIYNEQSDAWEAMLLRSMLGSFRYDFQIKSVNWQLPQKAVVRFRVEMRLDGVQQLGYLGQKILHYSEIRRQEPLLMLPSFFYGKKKFLFKRRIK